MRAGLCNVCSTRYEGAANFCGTCGADLRGVSGDGATRLSAGPARAMARGRLIAGRYRVLEPIGEGGMGSVWKVEHVRIEKTMALKVLRGGLDDRRAVERFTTEARAASKLTSSHTVSVHDFGEDEEGFLFIVMEYVDGRDLATVLAMEGPLPPERAVLVTAQVLSALGEAHDLGLVHRDIKPANVMLVADRDGRDVAKVLDFGFAKLVGGARDGRPPATTRTGEIVGTPDYMAPEQVRGGELSPATDVYAVGAMLFQLVTGRPPFVGKNAVEVMTSQVGKAPPRPSELAPPGTRLPPGLEAAILRALEKDPKARFRNADHMRQELATSLGTAVRRALEAEPARRAADDEVPSDGPTQPGAASRERLRALGGGLPVSFRAGDKTVDAKAKNVSPVGMFVQTDDPLTEGTHTKVLCSLPGDGDALEAEVKILFVVPPGNGAEAGMAVEFVGLDEAERARIERASRRRTR